MKSFKEITTAVPNSALIVDSLNLGFRWKHANATDFCEEYISTVESLKKSYKCDKVIILGDGGASSYRKALYSEYKSARKEKFATQSERERVAFEDFLNEMRVILETYSTDTEYPVLKFKGVEADDLAAYIVSKRKKLGLNIIWLISSDRDWLLNLAPGVSQFSYVTRKEFTVDNWHEHYDFSIEDYISIKVLQGDAGDSVPGVDGIGQKRAEALITQYGSALDIIDALPIDSKYKYIKALNAFGKDKLLLNYKLMDLVTYCEDAIGEENCRVVDQILKNYLQ